ncbi:MAG: hypothetical protein E7Z90_04125 [Cyanobacteria bacterium SIG29]|nr:hypothetical protein [Cyanobacteria bacterium SIG29]
MDYINSLNGLKNVNESVSSKIKVNKQNKKVIENKQVQVSSLDALQRYGRAVVSFAGEKKDLSQEDFSKLTSKIGEEKLLSYSTSDYKIISDLVDLYGINNINELDYLQKRSTLHSLVRYNSDLFSVSEVAKKDFPLFPTNEDEYSSLMKGLISSIGINTNELTQNQISRFNATLFELSEILADISDEEFNAIEIHQDYSKDAFIEDVFSSVKDLTEKERQKVFDYFGFELKSHPKEQNKYIIVGYPTNSNDENKLINIEEAKTRAVVEKLRSNVIKFSQDNYVSCSNKNLEKYINHILSVCPELRTQIDRQQHGTHEFDVFKHSLKVVQKIAQQPEYRQLDESDKKIMLLSALLHDSNKTEAIKDKQHARESAFDAFFIAKKFNLSEEESEKLYSIIKNHEWLGYTNSSEIKTDEEKEKRLYKVANDLRDGNLFELSKIFTAADLKAVQKSDAFYDKVGNVFAKNSFVVKSYINQLNDF